MKSSHIKARLATLSFLEFAIWGSYLVSMGMFLGKVGLGDKIYLFYMVQGLVSLIMPAVMGIIADRYIQAQKTLALCHFISAGFMAATGFYAMSHPRDGLTWILPNLPALFNLCPSSPYTPFRWPSSCLPLA